MAYASWSVIFGEQPTAAKWNILGTNDAEFNSLIVHSAGGFTTFNDIRTQTHNSEVFASSTSDLIMVQSGWAQINGDGSAGIALAITFPTAFDTILSVQAGLIGSKGSAGTSITDFTSAAGVGASVGCRSISTSGFTMTMTTTGTFAIGTRNAASWIAFGTKA
jgi:hypothetical protein